MMGLERERAKIKWSDVSILRTLCVAGVVTSMLHIAAAEERSQWATFFEPVEVPVVNVEVLVTDSDGNPIPGLTAEDFEVFEDGQPVTVTNFYAAPGVARPDSEHEGPPEDRTAEVPDEEVFLAFYIDENNLEPRRRHATLNHLREFLQEPLPPRVRAMLVRYDGSLEIQSEFTDDSETLLRALDEMSSRTGSHFSREAEFLLHEMQAAAASRMFRAAAGGEASSRTSATSIDLVRAGRAETFLPQIRAIARNLQVRNRQSLSALRQFVGLLSGVSGRKGIVWMGSGLESQMAENLFRSWERLFPGAARSSSFDTNIAAREYDTATDVAELIRVANANRVSFFTLSSFAVGGTMTAPPDLAAMTITDSSGTVDLLSEDDALLSMSTLTGGRSVAAGEGIRGQLDEFERGLTSYYSLGYRPPSPGDGEYHRIRVRVRQRGVHLSYREGYQDAAASEQIVDRTLAAAVLGIVDNPMGISVECRPEEPHDDGRFLVPVLIRIPVDRLVLLPDGPNHTAQISLYTAVRDDSGRVSEVYGRQYPMEVANKELLAAVAEDAGFIVSLVVSPGPKRIAVGVRDERSQIGSTAVVEATIGALDGNPG
jgi:VWFA-related protein